MFFFFRAVPVHAVEEKGRYPVDGTLRLPIKPLKQELNYCQLLGKVKEPEQ
jgi:hypothetical protein